MTNTIEKLEPFAVGYGTEQVVFSMRMLSLQEEDAMNKRFTDLKDLEGDALFSKQYEVLKTVLKDYEAEPARLLKGETYESLPEGFFDKRTNKTERILWQAHKVFTAKLYPDVDFLPPSPPLATSITTTASEGEN